KWRQLAQNAANTRHGATQLPEQPPDPMQHKHCGALTGGSADGGHQVEGGGSASRRFCGSWVVRGWFVVVDEVATYRRSGLGMLRTRPRVFGRLGPRPQCHPEPRSKSADPGASPRRRVASARSPEPWHAGPAACVAMRGSPLQIAQIAGYGAIDG